MIVPETLIGWKTVTMKPEKRKKNLQVKKLLDLHQRILGIPNTMPVNPRIRINLKVIPTFHGLIPKEMNLCKVPVPIGIDLLLNMIQTIPLIPPGREDIKTDLSTDTESQPKVRKLLSQNLDELFANFGGLVVFPEVQTFLMGRITTDRRDIDHPVTEFDECTAFDGDVEVGDVVEDKGGEFFVSFFSDIFDEGGRGEFFAETEGGKAVFGEAVVEESGDVYTINSELFLLLAKVAAADVSDDDFRTEVGEELEHLRADETSSRG